MTLFRYYATNAALDTASSTLWEAYAVAERIRRGLPPGAPLDVNPDGTPAETITTTYVEPIRLDGQLGGVLTLDAWAQTVITDGVAIAALPEPFKSAIEAMYTI